MGHSTLRRVLTLFESTEEPRSLPQLAHDLGVSPARLDAMIQHWVHKGKIRESGRVAGCGTCSKGDTCAFAVQMPRTYELIRDASEHMLTLTGPPCGHESRPKE